MGCTSTGLGCTSRPRANELQHPGAERDRTPSAAELAGEYWQKINTRPDESLGMELATILFTGAIAIIGIAVLAYIALKWAALGDQGRQATITQLYAVAKSLHDARADGKITPEEMRTLFAEILGVIAAMRNVDYDQIDAEFPAVETPANTDQYPGTLPGNYYPELLRISTGSIEMNGGKVGPSEDEITIGRKGQLYAAVTCEVTCGYTIRCYLDGSSIAASTIHGGIAGSNVGRENAVTIPWPGTNGYPTGDHEALFVLSDQNDVDCNSISITIHVVADA